MSSVESHPDVLPVASVVVLVPAWRVDRTFDYLVPAPLADRVRIGSLVRVPFGHRKVRAIVVAIDERPGVADDLLEIAALVVDAPVAAPPMDELLDWLARRYVVTRGRAFDRVAPTRVRVETTPAHGLAPGPDPKIVLGYERGPALVEAIEGRGHGVFVLRPVAGENRGRLIAELAAAAGRADAGAALVCVPEVRYGSSVLDELTAAWPDMALVDTSRSERERAGAWLALANGAPLGGGGRAAVLAPCPRLRLIVLDEEHHRTYKEDRAPKYDARRVALERARLQDAVCVLVSGAPTVESGAAAARTWVSVEPSRAAARAARPIVELCDVPPDRAISHELHERVRSTLRDGRRAGLLVPTRGYARSLWCGNCRRSLRCTRCEAGMAFDRSEGRLRCPHCALVATPPSACPACGATDWHYMGAGSERVAEQIARAFPRATVARVDPGSIGEEGARAAQIYVTTWIGTKEVLRPEVGLVGVLNADSLVRRPDFRAAEHAYQALSEMAEWAGPAAGGGRLVVQTSEPAHHAIQAVVRADYRFFLDRELPLREELGYPPFSELIKAVAIGPRADDLIRQVADACRDDARVLGPMAARIDGRRDPNARELLAKCRDALVVAERLRDILAAVPAGNRLTIDVDPR
jgi:primosomal protein N' (replication factor Y) (superfamily II helicase)